MRNRLLTTLALLLSTAMPAQTLARPGWAGSGLNVEPWWTHAVLYELDPHRFSDGNLHGAAAKLDYIHSLGVDAVALTHLSPEAAAPSNTIDPVLGTLDDFDDLVREASRSGIRILVELDPKTPELDNAARFWLGHGVAGISLHGDGPASGDAIHTLREVTRSIAGQRILVAEAAAGDTAHTGADLILATIPTAEAGATGLQASTIRPILERLSAASATRPVATLDHAPGPEAARALGTLLLATRSNAQLHFGQEIGMAPGATMSWGDLAKPSPSGTAEIAAQEADPDSTLNWYRRLIDLHHGNGVFRSGTVDFLNRDAQNSLVWVMRKAQVTPLAPALVIACNLSDKPVTLSLTDDLHALHLRGSFLRTLARSDKGLGGVSLNAVTLPPFGVYIGELRF